ncbi:hypothetical protein BN381_560002 [Candidatus Microthrix parvicella RN1]|uniref:beta-N-acetylhexosaminidase n=2 Tax=Candidatus Neomicrothrix TaxID=41949 RepID=R4Z748_9ACTN|nr:hypothetical protein BN381_560002 [Candidatus Microthrix parvicella RN1]
MPGSKRSTSTFDNANSEVPYGPSSASKIAWVPHSASATRRAWGNAERSPLDTPGDDMGYDGVAVTDELAEMGAVTQRGISVPDAVEESLIAGNDMALCFADVTLLGQVLDQLERAVADGRLSQGRGDESLQRVLTLKLSAECLA